MLRSLCLTALLLTIPALAPAATVTELTLAVAGEPEAGFDPTLGWAEYGAPLLQSTLLKRDANLALVGDLATGWEVSADGLRWTVRLRPDVRFSDGQALTAEDVAYTYRTAKQAGSVLDLTSLAEISVVDSTTLQFTLTTPRVTFLNSLATLGIVPRHAHGPNYGKNPIGSGPFRLLAWRAGEQAILAPNPHYYGTKSGFEKITLLFTKEDATYAAARAGKLHVAAMPNSLAGSVPSTMTRLAVKTVDNRGIAFPMQLSTGRTTDKGYPIGNNVTSDPAIRKAINIAIDRAALAAGVLNGFGRPAHGPADDLPWDNRAHRLPDADPVAAKALLDAAGWVAGADGVRVKNGQPARFSLYYNAADSTRQALALAVADMVRPIGIHIAVIGASWDKIKTEMHASAVLFGAGSHDPYETYNLYVGNGATAGWWFNTGLYDNATVRAHFDQALTAPSLEALLPGWQAAAWDGATGYGTKGDAAWAWLVNIDHVYFIDKCLDVGPRQVEPHGHGFPVTYNLESWRWTCP